MSTPSPWSSTQRPPESRLVRLATVAYLLLTVYASLYPFVGWREPNATVFSLLAGPTYNSSADIVLNVSAYLPLGLLVTLALLPRHGRWRAAAMGMMCGALLSTTMEVLQAYLPTRVPSKADIACNVIGAIIGATLAAITGPSLLGGRFYDYRRRVFPPDVATDLGFLLLGLWAVTQLNPEIWLFGNGDMHALISLQPAVKYSAPMYVLLEAGVAASGYCALILLLSSLARPRAPILDALLFLSVAALVLKSIASAFLFNGGHLWLWVTPGSTAGMVVGSAVGAILAKAQSRLKHISIAVCLVITISLVNIAPSNPYLEVLHVWQHGHYASFNATTRLLASVWPFVAFVFVIYFLLRRPKVEWNMRDSPR